MRSVLLRRGVAEAARGTGPGEDGRRDFSDAAEVQGTPGAPGAGRHGKASPRQGPEGVWPCDTSISDFWPPDCKTTSTCSLKSPSPPSLTQDTKTALLSWSAGRGGQEGHLPMRWVPLPRTGAQGAARDRGCSGLRPGSLPTPAESHTLCPSDLLRTRSSRQVYRAGSYVTGTRSHSC